MSGCELELDVNRPNDLGETALHLAAQDNDFNRVKSLISEGAEVNLYDVHGWNPLCFAAMRNTGNGHHEVMELLLKNGADINCLDIAGRQPLHYLVAATVETVQMFLDFGADVDKKDRVGETPIFYELLYGSNLGVVKLLVSNGAELNVTNNNGSTPLHAACSGEFLSLQTLKYLLKNGADIDALDNDGRTPLIEYSFSEYNSDTSILDFLLKYAHVNVVGKNTHTLNGVDPIRPSKWKSILKHLAKLQALDTSICPEILETINSNSEYRTWFQKCKQELSAAKNTKLRNSWVTFFKLLVDNKRRLKNYAGNKGLIKDFKNTDCLRRFPIYGASMIKNVEKGIKRRELFDKSAVMLTECLPIVDPGHLITRDMLDLLSTKDLRVWLKRS